MEVLFVFVLVYSVVSACLLSDSGPKIGGRPTGRCGNCRYELAGLPAGSPCPECGSQKLEVKGAKSTVNRERLARWTPTLLVFCVTVVFSYQLAELILVLSYVHDYFSVDAALRSMQTRELSDRGAGAGGVLFPLMVPLSFSPFIVLAPSRRAAAWWLVGVAGCGLLATVAFWTVLQPGYR